MNRTLTSAQFMHLWEATGLDRMPHPFEHRTSARLESERGAEERTLEHRSADDPGSGIVDAIDVLRRPEVSVSVYLPNTPPILRRGAIRGRVCVVADQRHTAEGTGDLELRVGAGHHAPDVRAFVRALLDGVPPNTPGRTRSVNVHPDELGRRPRSGTSVLHDVLESGAPLLEHVLAARTTTGYLCLHRPWRGAEDQVVDSLTWFDVPGDGRYLYHEGHRVELRSAMPGLVDRELETRVRKALADPSTQRSRTLPWSPCRKGTGTRRADH